MTLEQIRNEVVRVIGLDETEGQPDLNLVDSWASAAVLDILMETRCFVQPATMETTANQADYDLSTGILHVLDLYVTDSGTAYRLKQVSPQQLIDMRVGSNVQAESPATHFSVAGSNLLMLYPTPTSVTTLTLYYVPRPAPMSFDSHNPSTAAYGGVPDEFHRAIVKFALAEAADYRDDQTSQHGDRYRKEYQFWVGKIRKAVNQKGHTETPAFEIRGRSYPPHDPSADYR